MFEGVINFMTNQPTNPIAVYIYVPLFYLLGPALLYLPELIALLYRGALHWMHFLPLMQLAMLCTVRGDGTESVWFMICCWGIMKGIAVSLLIVVSTPIHRSDFCWTEGDAKGTKDFLEHTLLSTMDYYTDWGLLPSLFMFDTFNDHRMHHLFPTLDVSRVRTVKPVFERFCEENGLGQYFKKRYGLGELFMGLLRNWYRTEEVVCS